MAQEKKELSAGVILLIIIGIFAIIIGFARLLGFSPSEMLSLMS